MTSNVFVGTLNLAQSLTYVVNDVFVAAKVEKKH